jgi:glyoxylase-like metal-dependent hydrolase (beta-lactamase superfamily II)
VTAEVAEPDLADLGVFRIPVPIPFSQAGGPVNVYLLEEAGGGLALFDSGLGTEAARAALEEGFRGIGRSFRDVTRIVVSHGHVDHYGGARAIQEARGGEVPVLAHPLDVPKIVEGGWRWRDEAPRYGAYLARLGVPAEVLAAVAREGERGFGMARRIPEVRPVREGETLRTRHLRLELLHMPGHTPGLLVAHDRERRILLSDDHLLERISPNPLIDLGPEGREGWFRPLLAYLESLERTRRLEVDLVLPGHGPPFSGHRRVIDGLLRFHGERQARIREVLSGGPRPAWEVARALFPASAPGEAFLVVSEVVANLEVLEARGEVARALEDGIYRFALA